MRREWCGGEGVKRRELELRISKCGFGKTKNSGVRIQNSGEKD